MKLIILATGKTEEVNESFGLRLIEQGKAVLAPEAPEEEMECRVADAPRNDREKSAKKR